MYDSSDLHGFISYSIYVSQNGIKKYENIVDNLTIENQELKKENQSLKKQVSLLTDLLKKTSDAQNYNQINGDNNER